jgi:hypothetical protein
VAPKKITKEQKKEIFLKSAKPEKISEEALKIFKKQIRKILKENPPVKKKSHGEALRYKRKFCYDILDHFVEGKDKITVSSELGISYQRFCSWRKLYPEFDYAVTIGEQLSLRYWAEMGRLNLDNRNFNHVLWMMNMTNRWKWYSNRNKEEKKVKKIDKKILEVNLDDKRIAKIINLASDNQTIVDSGNSIEDKQEIYTN